MNLSSLRQGELKEAFDALEEAFVATGVDFYLIGAMATNIWYARDGKIGSQTKDVDFAVLVGSLEEYEGIKDFLKENKNFADTKGNSFVMMSPVGVQVDILPFGEIEIDEGVHMPGEGLTNIKVNGFREVYQSGTEEVEIETGHRFQVATLPAIVLLKLIAFDDRPERRFKDARDVAGIIEYFFGLQADLIYSRHLDLFTDSEKDQNLQEMSAIVIGREMREIIGENKPLLERVKRILEIHINEKEESSFVRNMVAETDKTVEKMVKQLENILRELKQPITSD